MAEVWLWFKAFVPYWWALMSCAAFTALSVYAAIKKKGNRWVVIATASLAILFFGVASFEAWDNEHDGRLSEESDLNRTRAELADLRNDRSPHMSGVIDQKLFGVTDGGTIGVLVLVAVRNTGEPSIAERWRLRLQSGPSKLDFHPGYFNDGFTMHGDNGFKLTLKRHDALEEHFISPLPRGAVVRGWLRFSVTGLSLENVRDATWSIVFEDVLGNEGIVRDISKSDIDQRPGTWYYPGSKPVNIPFERGHKK